MRFWYGMRFATLLRAVWRHHDRGAPLNWPALLTGLTIGVVNSALTPLDRLVWSRTVAKTALEPHPLFVLGHWRCGTTYLHELLALDPRHTFPTTYQCMAPEHFLLSQGGLRRWLAPEVSGTRPIDQVDVGWDRPQEDEFALCNLGLPSPYLFLMFPAGNHDPRTALDLEDLHGVDRERWKAQLTRFLKRVGLGAPGRRIIVKSPPHTARIPILRETFHHARFVHIVRDPADVVSSMLRLYGVLLPILRVSNADLSDDELREHVFDIFSHLDSKLETARAALPAGTFAQLRYEDLVADPVGSMRILYRDLTLGDFAPMESVLRRHLAEAPVHDGRRHRPSAALRAMVGRRLGQYCRRHGYTSDDQTRDRAGFGDNHID